MPTGLGFAPLAWEAVGELLDGGLPERRPAPGERTSASRRSCASVAPDGRGDPSIVVLGDGFENDAQWEISDVAYRLGVPMVTLDDIRQREGRSTPTSTVAGAGSTSSTGARTTTCCATRTAARARSARSCSSRSGAAP